MDNNEYVRSIIRKYHLVHDATSPAVIAAQSLFPTIKAWANNYLLEVRFSGSTAKGTAIRGSTDVDLFISLNPDTPGSLRDIYENLHAFLIQARISAKRQDVSIGITLNGTSVDLVPGRKQKGNTSDHSLYRNKGKTWIQTNVEQHIKLISESGRLDEIRSAKIWRMLHGLEFPSFYLEMIVLYALYRKPTNLRIPMKTYTHSDPYRTAAR